MLNFKLTSYSQNQFFFLQVFVTPELQINGIINSPEYIVYVLDYL
jgi:hypothetical protein